MKDKETYTITCKKGYESTFDFGDYSEFCHCGEKYSWKDKFYSDYYTYFEKVGEETIKFVVNIYTKRK